MPLLFPALRLFYFVPVLITAYYQKPLTTCLWYSILCGLLLDFLSTNDRLGMHSLAYSISTLILYGKKRNFFADSLSTLPLMTYFFSASSTFVLAILMQLFEIKTIFSWRWILADFLVMPLADALFAFLFFIVPALLIGKPPKKGKDYFLAKN